MDQNTDKNALSQSKQFIQSLNEIASKTLSTAIGGDNYRPQTASLYQLDNLGVIHISGPESGQFLQGQLTIDTVKMRHGEALLGGHCDHKGRLQSNFFICRRDDNNFYCLIKSSLLERALTALKKYAVFSKCELNNRSDTLTVLAIENIEPEALAQEAATHFSCELPEFKTEFVVIDTDNCTPTTFYKAIQPTQSASAETSAETEKKLTFYSANEWHVKRMRSCIALLDEQSAGEHIPQMLNMDLHNAIDWNKGCYTGQEVVARLKYRGSVNRRVFVIEYCPGSNANREQILSNWQKLSILDQEGKIIGELVESPVPLSHRDQDAILALAVIQLKRLEIVSTSQPSEAGGDKRATIPCQLQCESSTFSAELQIPDHLARFLFKDDTEHEEQPGSSKPT